MLKNVKSLFFLRVLFSYMDEKQKLELIRYNKNLQNTININLNNYKFFSWRYIEFEADGKGKEYDFKDTLKFEGEYLNGKRNGKGKEYYCGELKFEGEYLNGKKNGKGKVYYNGELFFEGEYLNGKINGKGKEYYDNGQLIFEGEY